MHLLLLHFAKALPSGFDAGASSTRAAAKGARSWIVLVLGGLLALASLPAAALQITRLTPQGEVARIRQVVAKFDAPAIRFGDPAAAAPLAVQCDDPAAGKGSGRWTGDREWVFDFEADLPPGVHCSVRSVSSFKSASGALLTGATSYTFNSGGPLVQNVRPGTWERIDEQQYFVLRFNGATDMPSLKAHAWCEVEGIGEQVPLRLIDPTQRAQVLKALHLDKAEKAAPQAFAVVACNRTLPAAAHVTLVVDKGVTTPGGTPSSAAKRFTWQVREPFTASFSCERENAQSACLPLRPLTVVFSAPVTRKEAAGIRLESPTGSLASSIDNSEDDESTTDQAVATADKTAKKKPDPEQLVNRVSFAPPLAENTRFTLKVPATTVDAAGRVLSNADSFPLQVATGSMPPLAKFASSPFGILESHAEPEDGPAHGKALLPVTVRNIEASLQPSGKAGAPAGQVSDLTVQSDADIIRWSRMVLRYDDSNVPRKVAARDIAGLLPKKLKDREGVETRSVSLLAAAAGAKRLQLPQPAGGGNPRPFEVVGIPLDPGYHVVEIASPRLGKALLDPDYGDGRTMYVRTTALVTNLGVHFKLGRENALAWVTTLDKGQPVEGALVRVADCSGKQVAEARTGADGIARFDNVPTQAPRCGALNPPPNASDSDDRDDYQSGDSYRSAYFVSARTAPGKDGSAGDMAFTGSDWMRGIEPWRFNVPTSQSGRADVLAHTVFDRTLFRAGETVSMKHFVRNQTADGFALPMEMPNQMVVTHVGSGQQFVQQLVWRKTATGGKSAESSFVIPPAAKLGEYSVALRYREPSAMKPSDADDDDDAASTATAGAIAGRPPVLQRFSGTVQSGEFRVEEFRLPVFAGSIEPSVKGPLVQPADLSALVQIQYVNGGAASGLPVKVSALVRNKQPAFADFDDFNFSPPRSPQADSAQAAASADGEGDETVTQEAPEEGTDTRVIADKLALLLDKSGAGSVRIAPLPASQQPRELLLEASYSDPNGEVQTLHSSRMLWPAGVIAGVHTEGWVSLQHAAHVQALALDLDGKPRAGVALSVRAVARSTTSSRKRMVGGFYTYDNRTQTRDLGEVCKGKSDAHGLLLCDAKLSQAGEVELTVTATDDAGRTSRAAQSVYVTRQGEMWFGGQDHDRIDLLPEKKSYEPGETAVFQVRMPFRYATALVSVEREGILKTEVVQLNDKDPTVRVKVEPDWGPNVYVSVLALRGRLREVPWYSFFSWGYKAPREWWTAFRFEGRDYVAPTALVDLSKPAFRFGMAEIRVAGMAHRLDVTVKADKADYQVRGVAHVRIHASLTDGSPAANAEVAVAAVDQALLGLMPNTSWNLLEAMLQRRPWGVSTATAQMEIVGRRHFGRKAVPAGGGGGHSAARQLLDTLLLWKPAVQLDAQGNATVDVPLNDALTQFRIVAVADSGVGRFGTGDTTIRVTQDLQIISGLPPLVREGDSYRAQVTLRNTTSKPMKIEANAQAGAEKLEAQMVEIAPDSAREIAWNVTAPVATGAETGAADVSLEWTISARDTTSGAKAQDALKARQRVVPAVPVTVQQGTLVQLDGDYTLEVAAPAGALAISPSAPTPRGGIRLALQPRLAEGLPAVRRWFAHYPFICLEQKTSKAVGLADGALWQKVAAELPTYLDKDGLASYFPPRAGYADRGSDTLTAYLLAATNEASALHPKFVLPEGPRDAMLNGLTAFVEGRIQRNFWSPRRDLDVRKIAALEALSRYGRAEGRMVGSVSITPNEWPTSAVIDWFNVLKRVKDVPQRDKRLAEAEQILRARLSTQGTKLIFSTEQSDDWWWLMVNGDVNTARLILAVLDAPAWKDDMGRLASGFIARQQNGAWRTTNANLWGSLALEKFSAKFESTPVTGVTQATLGSAKAQVDWAQVRRATATDAGGTAHANSLYGAPSAAGNWLNNTMQLPWPAGAGTLAVTPQPGSTGKPWLTIQSLAAVPRVQPFSAGYRVQKTITPVQQAVPGHYTRGDVLRITLKVRADADMTWVVLSDPIPGGATILGGGLGRDSQIAIEQSSKKAPADEKDASANLYDAALPAFEERSFEAWRGYYEFVPKGDFQVDYTVRLNNVGQFSLPPTRIEALYAPEMFGETPNAAVQVEAQK